MAYRLQIQNPRERRLVAAVDVVLSVATAAGTLFPGRRRTALNRILLLRLERIGDLLMTLPAIDAVRQLAPASQIDLVVGSWNEKLARVIPGLTGVETLDAPWLARNARGASPVDLLRATRRWRNRRYDLAINFEGDIRSHFLMWLSGASRRVGFASGGGGPLLTDPLTFEPRRHVCANALRLVAHTFGVAPATLEDEYMTRPARERRPRLQVTDTARAKAVELIGQHDRQTPLVAIHASGGRAIKQWPAERFAEVARRLAAEYRATIVLSGTTADREIVDRLTSAMPSSERVINLTGDLDVVTLAAVLERVTLLVTGDTGPMHLADAVNTPVVAVFGLTDPARYGPLLPDSRIVRIDLPCSPCNRVRQPPQRCVGHTPDCLTGIDAESVLAEAARILSASRRRHLPTIQDR